MGVRKAVIPAAGLGTRFLPATKAVPKEMVPVVDRPAIQYAVEEAAAAGLRDVVIITGRGKEVMADHFDHAPDLENALQRAGKLDELAEVGRTANLADIHFVRQKTQLGFGHAVLQAEAHVGGEPFAVLVPDEIVPDPDDAAQRLMTAMIAVAEERGASVVALRRVVGEEISAYGCAQVEPVGGPVVRILDLVEKPAPADAPSDLAVIGRYVLEPAAFAALRRTGAGLGGEIQLTDALRLMAADGPMYGYVFSGAIFDVGRKLPYLQATVELALRRDDLAKPFRQWLERLVAGDR